LTARGWRPKPVSGGDTLPRGGGANWQLKGHVRLCASYERCGVTANAWAGGIGVVVLALAYPLAFSEEAIHAA
jgi:hypothetical protein